MKRVAPLALSILFFVFQAQAEDKTASPEDRITAEWNYLKDISGDRAIGTPAAMIESLSSFIERNPETLASDEAQELLAGIYKNQGDYKSAMLISLRLLYGRPSSRRAVKAQSELLDLGKRNLATKARPALEELIKPVESTEKDERLATMLHRIVEGLGEALYEPTVQEIRRFQLRFPEYAKRDAIQWDLAQLHKKALKYPEAVLAFNSLMRAFPDSAYCPQALLALGDIYVDGLREYKKATDVYQELVEKYPSDTQALPALQRSSMLFSDYLKQYELSAQMDEKIIKTYPKTDEALKAYKHEALLMHDRLNQPRAAVNLYKRIAAEHPQAAAVEALQAAALIARKDLKDYDLEIELRSKIGNDYSTAPEAAQELFSVAQIYELDKHDIARAIRAYRDVRSKFIDSKFADKADKLINKLR